MKEKEQKLADLAEKDLVDGEWTDPQEIEVPANEVAETPTDDEVTTENTEQVEETAVEKAETQQSFASEDEEKEFYRAELKKLDVKVHHALGLDKLKAKYEEVTAS